MIKRLNLPKYECHKYIWALQIKRIDPTADGGAIITPVEGGFAPFHIDADYLDKYRPVVGGYYVVDADENGCFLSEAEFQRDYVYMYSDSL